MNKNSKSKAPVKAHRGFRAMAPELQRDIASKGGLAISQDRDYMGVIGARGGAATQKNIAKLRRAAKKAR